MHRWQVDEIMMLLLLNHLMAMLLALLLMLELPVLLMRKHRLPVLALPNLVRMIMWLLMKETSWLVRFSIPNTSDLEVSAFVSQCVTCCTAAIVQLTIFTITAQHSNGKKDEQDEDATAGNWHCDGGRLEPQVVTDTSVTGAASFTAAAITVR